MSDSDANNPSRLDELMVDAATEGLPPQDEAELSIALRDDTALRTEQEAYDLAAAAIDLALASRAGTVTETLPAALREKLLHAATEHAEVAKPSAAQQLGLRLSGAAAAKQKPSTSIRPAEKFSWTDGRMFGWYAAAAALIALAVLLIQTPGGGSTTPTPVPTPTLAQQYDALNQQAGTIAADWSFNADGGDPRFSSASGQVIWNPATQTGYMKLAGLPVNDPSREQYQLWIVDPTRDAEPVDGGVFDITKPGEVIVPIDAKLAAKSPAVFAITIEQPGGVVVSEGPLQIVAPVPTTG